MSKPIAVCGWGAEVRAEQLQRQGLDCKTYSCEANTAAVHSAEKYMNALSEREVFVFVIPPSAANVPPGPLLCQIGAALAAGRCVLLELLSEEVHWHNNPFLSFPGIIKLYSAAATNQFLTETC